MAPSLSIFGDFTKDANIMYNNFRVYGTGLLLVMGTIVFIGVKFVNKFATIALACVILSIIAVYVGLFVNFNGNDLLKWVLSPSYFFSCEFPLSFHADLSQYLRTRWSVFALKKVILQAAAHSVNSRTFAVPRVLFNFSRCTAIALYSYSNRAFDINFAVFALRTSGDPRKTR